MSMEKFHTESYPEANPEWEPDMPQRWGGFRRFLIDLLETVLMALVLFLAINAVSARIRVESISMQPTLFAGDFVIVNKVAYKLGTPERGDIIVFHFPPDPEREPYIKRVVGLPGDRVAVTNGRVYINDQAVIEPYIKAPPNYEMPEMEIPENELFVLGDNRNNSSDSHHWGTVPLDYVIGKAEVVYWPPSEWQVLNGQTAVAADS